MQFSGDSHKAKSKTWRPGLFQNFPWTSLKMKPTQSYWSSQMEQLVPASGRERCEKQHQGKMLTGRWARALQYVSWGNWRLGWQPTCCNSIVYSLALLKAILFSVVAVKSPAIKICIWMTRTLNYESRVWSVGEWIEEQEPMVARVDQIKVQVTLLSLLSWITL